MRKTKRAEFTARFVLRERRSYMPSARMPEEDRRVTLAMTRLGII